MRAPSFTLFILPLLVSACTLKPAGPPLAAVSGTVTWKGQPLSGAQVHFRPIGDTRGSGASGRTRSDGTYTLEARGGAGATAGEYKVVISKLVMEDGTPLPEDGSVTDADVATREILPAYYSLFESTKLSVTVPEEGGTFNFDLK